MVLATFERPTKLLEELSVNAIAQSWSDVVVSETFVIAIRSHRIKFLSSDEMVRKEAPLDEIAIAVMLVVWTELMREI
tara:strand:- start:185 stop:418 length:234 start_codon:yes stop_codon:yes gene_type:complete